MQTDGFSDSSQEKSEVKAKLKTDIRETHNRNINRLLRILKFKNMRSGKEWPHLLFGD